MPDTLNEPLDDAEHAPAKSVRDVHDRFGASDMASRIADHDWADTPLGPIERWPASLLDTVTLMLRSAFQLAIYWGPEFVLLYNDAERAPLGDLHPACLGQPARVVLSDTWPQVGPMLDSVLATGKPTWSEDAPLVFRRGPQLEEAYFSWSYSAILGATGDPEGVLLVSTETTRRVLGERRLQVLTALAEATTGLQSIQQLWQRSVAAMAADPDIECAAVYTASGVAASAVAATSTARDQLETPPFDTADVENVARSGIELIRRASGAGPPSRHTVLMSLSRGHPLATASVLALAIKGVRLLDRGESEYLQLAATHITTAAANAAAYEQERGRAERRAALEERQRIERDLHDTIQRQLIGARLVTELARDMGMQDPAAVDQRLEEVSQHLGRALTELREVIEGSYPSQLRTGNLARAVTAAAERAHLTVSVESGPLGRLGELVERALYFATLEAVQNAFKHGGGGVAVHVRFREANGALSVHVHDSGTGFDPAQIAEGRGLRNMAERLQGIGGTCLVRSRPGRGTWVRLTCPIGRPVDQTGARTG